MNSLKICDQRLWKSHVHLSLYVDSVIYYSIKSCGSGYLQIIISVYPSYEKL